MMNQYKDPRELRELAQPLHQVEGFGQGNRAVQVSCGDSFTLVLNERNQLFSFGMGRFCKIVATLDRVALNVSIP